MRFFFVVLVWIEKTEEGTGFALSFFLFIFARGGLVDSSKKTEKKERGTTSLRAVFVVVFFS